MTLGALAFLNPWLLAGLAALPLIYWLLRAVPPAPQRISFPPTRILARVDNREKTPAKTPWWLLLIRLLAAALVILALAEPVLNPSSDKPVAGSGPVVIVVDNGWSSAAHWAERVSIVDQLISGAEAQGRGVIIVPTAAATNLSDVQIEAPGVARARAGALLPQPFEPDRMAAATLLGERLAGASAGGVGVAWLSDGIDHDGKTAEFVNRLGALPDAASVDVFVDAKGTEALGLVAGVGEAGKLKAQIVRAGGDTRTGYLSAFSAKGAQLGEAAFGLAKGDSATTVTLDLPLELRNQVTRISIGGENSAGAVQLLDARSNWNRVGLISGARSDQAQPLLAPLYYINKAMAPFAEIVRQADSNVVAGIDAVMARNVGVLVLADIGTLTRSSQERIQTFVERGGVLIRFAGPRLEKGGDDLLPVPLRLGGRTLGGALSWSTPQQLAPFEDNSLFAGLSVSEDVSVNRQVLADTTQLGPDVEVWARLNDGTPLVTAAQRGDGRIVLFHVTANSDWSNLPISGLFVQMLRRIATLARSGSGGGANETSAAGQGAEGEEGERTLAPVQTLDGFGVLKSPPATAESIVAAKFADVQASRTHPPGYYGTTASPRALNVLKWGAELKPMPALPRSVRQLGYEGAASEPLKPWFLAGALVLFLIDMVAILILQGGLSLAGMSRIGRAGASSVIAGIVIGAAIFTCAATDANAQNTTKRADSIPIDTAIAAQATRNVTLGYVRTGDPRTDETSRAGLSSLGKVLRVRTSVTPGEPIGVDIVKDEIAFYPVLYWPILENARALTERTLAKIDAYMKQGGLIIFDTRDFGLGLPTGFSAGGSSAALQRIVGGLDLPRLEPVPQGHVLTKSFYLLRTFPGRWHGGQLWVEAGGVAAREAGRIARRADGVTSIMITANDFAAAWALDDRGRAMFPTVPGGEAQREMAFRTGINIVMHALTGNYKADQVHVPALLERLGQ